MNTSLTEDEVIAGMYRAAQGEIDWRAALNPLTQLTECWVAQLMGVDRASGRITYSYEGGEGPAEAIVDYVQRYHQIDPHLQYLMPQEPGGWIHSNDYFDEEASAAHPFYTDFLIPYGDRYMSGMKVDQDDTTVVILGMHRAVGTTPLDTRGRALVERMGFHLQQAVRLWRKQRLVIAEAAIGRELLDRMGSAVFLVDEQRRLGLVNTMAYDMLNAGGVLYAKGQHLSCLDPDADRDLTLALRRLQLGGQMGLGNEPAINRSFVRIRQKGRQPVSICFLAVRPETTMGAFGTRATAMALIHDPNTKPELDPFMLANVFDLSPAEARVAVALAKGLVPKQVAVAHGISLTTVRTQISAIYSKVGVNSARELVTMLNTAPFAAFASGGN